MRPRFVVFTLLVFGVAASTMAVLPVLNTGARILGYSWWKSDAVVRSTVRIADLEADVYSSGRSHSYLMLVHGVNDTGKDNPEARNIAESFAQAGFHVVLPQFVRLTRQNVTTADIDDVASALEWMPGNTGMICVSYGCGPALIAASREGIRDRVRFAVVFGGYFDLTDHLRFIITEQDTVMAYSKWKYMAANADLVSDLEDRNAVIAVGAERAECRKEDWTISKDSLGPEAQAMVELFESSTAREFASRLQRVPKLRDRIVALSPSRHIHNVRAHLIIVHMLSDPAIPSYHSRQLAEAARTHDIPFTIEFLRMYGHTRPTWPSPGVSSLLTFYLPESYKFAHILNVILRFAS